MTGYASVQFTGAAAGEGGPGNARRLGLEIRSVNSRFLDLSLRLSDELRAQAAGDVVTFVRNRTSTTPTSARSGARSAVSPRARPRSTCVVVPTC